MGAPTKPSCAMCAYSFKYERAVCDITFGGQRVSVCAHHRDNPVADPRAIDLGPAPSNGTATSEKSARQSDSVVGPQGYLVLGVIAAAGPQGLVREEIYKIAKISNQAACARLKPLEDAGLIIVEGERYVPNTRRTQNVYKLAVYQTVRAAA